MNTWKKLVSCLLVLSMIVSMFVVVTAEEEDQPEASDDSISYSNCVDANGNPLNVKVVSGAQWVEDENGAVKMPAGVESSFLLFDTPLTTNRIEATVVINDNTFGDGNHRNGIVFALTDIQGDLDFWYGGTDVSYYWAFVNDWACVELWEMGAHQNWASLVGGSYVDLYSIGANPEQGVTLAAEWDANGNIKVFADGTPILEANDPTPLTGNYYGMVVNKWGNTQPSDYQFPYNAPVTSFVAGDAKLAITATAGEGGTVTEGGEFYRGQSVTVTATPDEGYNFVGWFVGDELVSADATYTFKVAGNCDLTAKFAMDTYAVTIAPTENGTAVGGGEIAEGSNATVVATPDVGYKFTGWFVGDELVSADATYTFTVNADCTLTAKFEKVTSYSVAVDGEGNPLNPYFVSGNTWTEADGAIKPAPGAMENFILFDNALANNRVEATFRGLPLNNDGNTRNGIVFALSDIDGDNAFGMGDDGVSYYFVCVSGYGEVQLIQMGAGKSWANYTTGGHVDVSNDVTLTVEWDTDGNVKVFANGELRIEKKLDEFLTGNLYGILMRSWANTEGGGFSHKHTVTSFVAGGASEAPDVSVTVTVDPVEGGAVEGAGDYILNQSVTLTATPNEGYSFVGWYENGELVSADATYTFNVTADRNITATFTTVTYTITVSPAYNGTATGGGTFAEGAEVTLTAIPNPGYKFIGWYKNGAPFVESTDATYTFEVTASCSLQAKFEKVEYTVPVDAQGNKLNPYFVNGVTWVEEDGKLKMPHGPVNSFLLFDTPLANNRIEATIVINDTTWGDNEHRNGIVFALTDIDGDAANSVGYWGTDFSYYWAFVDDWNCLHLWEMSAAQQWADLTAHVDLTALGIDVAQGVTIAAEWDADGHIKVYANDALVMDFVDETPLAGNLYGLLVNKWGNSQPSDYQFPYDAPVTSFVAGGELVWAEPEVPEVPTAPESYENCVDGEGNLLNPVFVNDIYWELGEGGLKMPFGYENSFLLFDNALANNRVEATIVINDTGIWNDGNRRNGIVFALSDNAGDGSFMYWDTDISYYWAFVDDWNCLHVYEMSAAQQWADLTAHVDLPSIGIDVKQGVTIAVEWDADGHIKVFANGILAMDFVDETPLAGNLYGLLVNNYGNYDANYGPYDSHVTSFVAGGALATKDVNVDVTAEGGTVTGAGDYYLGQNVTLTATANERYKFLGWYAGEELVSKEATINFVATEDRALTAKFISFDEYQHILVESTETNLGEEVVVTLVIKNNPGIAGLVVSLNYNADVLTLIGAENGTLFSGFTWAENMLWDEAFNVTEDGVLATLTFAVAEGAEIGDYTIEVIVHECYDENTEDVDLVTIGGTITVNDAPEIMWGDANGDGVIDTRDITKLKKYLANYDYDTETSTETVGPGADANGDGVIDTRDITKLKKYLANYDYDTETSTEVLGPKN